MPTLDFSSLSLLTFVSLGVMAMALPFAMGRSATSPAARHAQRYFLLQAAAWICIVLASALRGSWGDVVFASLSTLAVAAAQWNMAHALQHWLGLRPGMAWLKACCVAGPLGFMLLWADVSWRFAWFSTVQAIGLCLLAGMCLAPSQVPRKGWRVVLTWCATSMACALLVRAVLALWHSDVLPDFTAPTWINHGFVVLAHIATTLTLVCVMVAWREESQQRLQTLALTDMLTGIANRRAFETQVPPLLERALRQHSPVVLMLMDLDHFKAVNDVHGHAVGDRALRIFAQAVQVQLRSGDLVARWGGEEFCLLVHALPSAVQTLYERLSDAVAAQSTAELGFALQFSAGCSRPYGSKQYDLETLVQRADTALYRAKAAGRAQMLFAEDPDTQPATPPAHSTCAPAPSANLPHENV